jgi:hypothetical protein
VGPGQQRRRGWIAALVAAVVLVPAGSAAAAERPSFGAFNSLDPSFDWHARDYVMRDCGSPAALKLKVRGAKGWLTSVGSAEDRGGTYTAPAPTTAGESTTVGFRKRGGKAVRKFHIRCLPADFPGYHFERERDGGPKMFSLQVGANYGAIIDANGVPVWWKKVDGEPDNIAVMPDGTISWAPVDVALSQVGDYEVRTLRGKLLHKFTGVNGSIVDVHDLRLLPNGNYMLGAQITYNEDLTAFGRPANSPVTGIEIQERTPDGKLKWKWSSRGNVAPEETGRWWDSPLLQAAPYDVVHWNAVEVDGHFILISMRHNDAIYKIDMRTGKIVWKLGGTPTPKSLEVLNDPLGDYPLGGQHDVRVQDDGTITIHDNRTFLPDGQPRLIRYKIDEQADTATLVESVQDPDAPASLCCGSARKLDNGDWLAGWGSLGLTAAYDAKGRRAFAFTIDKGFSYRSNPVPKGAVKKKRLRNAMDHTLGS